MDINIYKVTKEKAPYDLLLLADPSRELVEKYLEVSDCYVASSGKSILGTYLLRKNTSYETELLNIAVSPDHQKLGTGTLLLQSAIDQARLSGAKRLVLGTGTFGYQLTFYQRQGFRVDSIAKDFFIDNYDEPIYEDDVQHKDMLRLYLNL